MIRALESELEVVEDSIGDSITLKS
eukprot:SAG31_NODE_11032_length_1072_cov_1.662898_2_plen_24_part_01